MLWTTCGSWLLLMSRNLSFNLEHIEMDLRLMLLLNAHKSRERYFLPRLDPHTSSPNPLLGANADCRRANFKIEQ